jgi:hypothetical protein
MYTDDFMFYMGDMPAGPVQYGGRVGMCSSLIENYAGKLPKEYFPDLIAEQVKSGFKFTEYDTRPGSPITTLIIDPYNSGRPWTYQYCTEYGWF